MRASATPVRPGYTARAGEAVFVSRDAGGNFAIGVGRVMVAADDVIFVNDVVADFGRLACSAEGEAVLREGDALGIAVRIEPPDPPTEPANGWIIPPGGAAPGAAATVVYDPADWPRRGDPRSPASDEVLLRLLRQANAFAAGAGAGAAA